ncbi:MAG: hypothetical protein CFH17_01095 [Alphaproteobacteria bacterium MarineAlpha5_Bin7]|nr:MAG: hypothetical protein CFH17_01095 [Alphaproteobacteria bacterium MarineAlpha5_Bin7]
MRLIVIFFFLTGCTLSSVNKISNSNENKASVTYSGESSNSITINN